MLQELRDGNYSGNAGYHWPTHNVNRVYWWHGVSAEIREYVKVCKVCHQAKHLQRHPPGQLVPIPIHARAWEQVTADRITSLPKLSQATLP